MTLRAALFVPLAPTSPEPTSPAPQTEGFLSQYGLLVLVAAVVVAVAVQVVLLRRRRRD